MRYIVSSLPRKVHAGLKLGCRKCLWQLKLWICLSFRDFHDVSQGRSLVIVGSYTRHCDIGVEISIGQISYRQSKNNASGVVFAKLQLKRLRWGYGGCSMSSVSSICSSSYFCVELQQTWEYRCALGIRALIQKQDGLLCSCWIGGQLAVEIVCRRILAWDETLTICILLWWMYNQVDRRAGCSPGADWKTAARRRQGPNCCLEGEVSSSRKCQVVETSEEAMERDWRRVPSDYWAGVKNSVVLLRDTDESKSICRYASSKWFRWIECLLIESHVQFRAPYRSL